MPILRGAVTTPIIVARVRECVAYFCRGFCCLAHLVASAVCEFVAAFVSLKGNYFGEFEGCGLRH